MLLREKRNDLPASPSLSWMFTSQASMFVLKASLCSLSGQIDELAYISTEEYWFDGREKSMVCAMSSDGTVCAWDLQEVSCPGGSQDEKWPDPATSSVLARPFAFLYHHSQLVRWGVGALLYRWEIWAAGGSVAVPGHTSDLSLIDRKCPWLSAVLPQGDGHFCSAWWRLFMQGDWQLPCPVLCCPHWSQCQPLGGFAQIMQLLLTPLANLSVKTSITWLVLIVKSFPIHFHILWLLFFVV